MKIFKNILQASLALLLLFFVGTGCNKPGALTIDPANYDNPFTFSPVNGYPGQTVVLTSNGLDFSDVKEVSVTNTKAEVLEQSATTITIKVPVGALTGKIKLVKETSVIPSSSNFTVDGTPTPNIIEFSPAIIGSRDILTINGNLLDNVDSVYIGTKKAIIQAGTTASQLKVKTPIGLVTSKVKLYFKVMTSYGMLKVTEYSSATDLTLKLPIISSISPDIMALNVGSIVTIKTTMVDSISKIEFGTVNATASKVKIDAETMTVVVPANATTGKIKLTVFDGFTESGTFNVNLPTITSFLPDKGAEQVGTTRSFSLVGTNLNLITSVQVGSVTANIQTKTATSILFTVPGNAAGTISLISPNGTVKSAVPFFFTGNMWLADFDNMYSPVRLFNEPMYAGVGGSESAQGFASNVKSITNIADAHGNYRTFNLTFKPDDSPRFYIRGDQGGAANAAPDRFLLYTPNSQGVNFEFDIMWTVIPAGLVDAKGEVDLKLMFFNADQTAGGGYGFYTDHIKVKYDGPGVWKHVVVDTYQTRVANDTYMYNTSVPAVSSKKFAPNNCRIVTLMFQGSYGGTVAAPSPVNGQQMIVHYDNVKFVIN